MSSLTNSTPSSTRRRIPTRSDVKREKALRRLVDFVPAVSPRYMRPVHLAPLLERFELALRGEPQFVCCSAPPRHAKTESVLHVPAFALRRDPSLTFSYTTYADALSRSKSRKARVLAQRVGVVLDKKAVGEWRTREGGGVVSGGLTGPLTGHGVNIAIIDDPIKNRVDAESPTMRQRVLDFVTDVATTRVEPGGSIFVFMTRWHPDDLIGVLTREWGYTHIHLPAVTHDDTGAEVALWPERWTLEELRRKREKVGEYTWRSLYQGDPRARGAPVFGEPHTYSSLPRRFRRSFGVDLAYTKKTSADHSVCVEMVREGDTVYVVDVIRRRVTAPVFQQTCHALHRQKPTASWRWYYAAGLEKAAGEFFDVGEYAVPLKVMQTMGDKFTRALSYAAAWNAGRVLVPSSAPWLEEFLREHRNFTGVDDPFDDQVDASVAAFDELDGGDENVRTEVALPTLVNSFEAAGV